jgi:hypothetical protein
VKSPKSSSPKTVKDGEKKIVDDEKKEHVNPPLDAE